MTTLRRRTTQRARRGFSLIEVLMAIFILGIGIISVAALFPAGIAQQRRSVDDIIGPTVAQNAISILRSKLLRSDFGDFGDTWATIPGDWGWLRPGLRSNGAIDVFGVNSIWTDVDAIPYNPNAFASAPEILFTQGERYYPMFADRPEYVWDCMFRRFQGRVLVAVFVYRVNAVGGERARYGVERTMPQRLVLEEPWSPNGPDDVAGTTDDPVLPGTSTVTDYDPYMPSLSWQEAGQWILDQNNNIHRVLATYEGSITGTAKHEVELVRSVPFPLRDQAGVREPIYESELVETIWYIPAFVDQSDSDVRLTPVYVAVKEL